MKFRLLVQLLLIALIRVPLAGAQESAAKEPIGAAELIMEHITDSKTIEFPCFNRDWACTYTFSTWPVTIGGTTVDLGLTKHIFFLMLAAGLCAVVMISTARAHVRASMESGHPKGFAAGLESVVLYLRKEVFLPNLGHHGDAYVPFVLTLFFFILFMNTIGLVPYGSTPTGNISVTATLAICSFIATETAGMRAQGWGYIKTIVYWPSEMSPWLKVPLTLVMTPVEILGKLTKPFALTIRLFANMTAGHVIVLAMIGLIFTLHSWLFAVAVAPLGMAVMIMLLEVLVAILHAFIFSLLASVFIGQIRSAAH
jgi:F-type H+-transporting ATPase subunit a